VDSLKVLDPTRPIREAKAEVPFEQHEVRSGFHTGWTLSGQDLLSGCSLLTLKAG